MAWVNFTMASSSGKDDMRMHFISEAQVTMDEHQQLITLKYNEPSDEKDIDVQMVVSNNQISLVRTGSYTMEQRFDLSQTTIGELSLPEGRLDLTTTTSHLSKQIDYEQKSGLLDVTYTLFVQNEYSGEFQFQLKFYNDAKEIKQ